MNVAEFEQKLKEAGAAAVGYADMSPVKFAAGRDLPTGVSIVMPFTEPENLLQPGTDHLDTMADLAVDLLRGSGFRAEGYGYYKFFDGTENDMDPERPATALFQHKTCATRAGLGWIGRMGVLVSRQYGPRVWLVSVLTDAPLPMAEPITSGKCGQCHKCVEACPAGAISGALWDVSLERKDLLDVKKCQTHRKKLGENYAKPTCGLCLAACPFGKA